MKLIVAFGSLAIDSALGVFAIGGIFFRKEIVAAWQEFKKGQS